MDKQKEKIIANFRAFIRTENADEDYPVLLSKEDYILDYSNEVLQLFLDFCTDQCKKCKNG